MFNRQNFYRLFRHHSKGFTLIEVMIAIALLGIIAVAFLGALSTSSMALIIADERATAESIARTEMEYVKNCEYEYDDPPSYEKSDVESPTHPGYFVSIDASPLPPGEDQGIQKIIITVKHGDEAETAKEVLTLEDYKVDR